MNIQTNNGFTIKSGDKNGIWINNERVDIPKGMNTNCSTIINDKIYIGGYEWKASEKRFKRTFVALWHYLF